ncbi:MAG: LemA family protein, partial [Planctomycetota bacterium]
MGEPVIEPGRFQTRPADLGRTLLDLPEAGLLGRSADRRPELVALEEERLRLGLRSGEGLELSKRRGGGGVPVERRRDLRSGLPGRAGGRRAGLTMEGAASGMGAAGRWPRWVWALFVLAALGLWLARAYNRLQVLQNRVANAFGQIDVQLKRRHDLIPNLVETVRGYATHERQTLERVIEARRQAVSAGSVEDRIKAETEL